MQKLINHGNISSREKKKGAMMMDFDYVTGEEEVRCHLCGELVPIGDIVDHSYPICSSCR